MIRSLECGQRTGTVRVPSSKSAAHRALIVSAVGQKDTSVVCDGMSQDIIATISCLNALGATIRQDGSGLFVSPIKNVNKGPCFLECRESGSTLRFLLPLVGALGAECVFAPRGRLFDRPLSPLDSELIKNGMTITRNDGRISCNGRLTPGKYRIAGNVSSQYISGLLMALPLMNGDSELLVSGEIQSAGYIRMTEQALKLGGIQYVKQGNVYLISGNQRPLMPDTIYVEGDYSSASFFLCMGAVSEKGITVKGLDPKSAQGDKQILDILKLFGADVCMNGDYVTVKKDKLKGITVDASQIPDIIPPLCCVAAVCDGSTRIVNAGRLRIKESDRLHTTACMLNSLGADVCELESELIINGKTSLIGGTALSYNDHRIAMSAAVAACVCKNPVTVDGCECVSKSYPRFWDDFDRLSLEE